MDIEELLRQDAGKDLLRLSTAGSVDDGKSTLIGRLLYDSKSIYDDHLDALRASSDSGSGEIDFAHLTDGLKAEREQGITIDVAYRYFSTPKRKFIIADTPGHEQYTRNMATGASTANAALILIDARNGVVTQSKRHAFIASLLGIPHMIIAVNKMDLVDYSEEVFGAIKADFADFAAKLDVKDIHFIPVSALKGDNVVGRGDNTPWYDGPTVLSYLEDLYISSDYNLVDLRVPIQLALRPDSGFRGYCGKIESGVLKRGDNIVVLPSGKTSRVKSIVSFDGDLEGAFPPMSATFTLEDEIDISRGDMVCHRHNIPHASRHIEAMVVWMDEKPLETGRSYLLKHTTRTTKATVESVRFKIDVNTLSRSEMGSLRLNEIGRVALTCSGRILTDPYAKNRSTGAFILIDPLTNATAGAGMILASESSERKIPTARRSKNSGTVVSSLITPEERVSRYKQCPATVWLTGLHASGKNEMARELERYIFDSGGICVLLSGGTLRSGISGELEFDAPDRAEHLRRAAETARLLNDHGIICVCSFISPDAEIRSQLAGIVGERRFFEVFVDASLDFCRKRDKSGLYERAEKGDVENVAGIDFPYEPPTAPALHVEMDGTTIEQAVADIAAFMRGRRILPEKPA